MALDVLSQREGNKKPQRRKANHYAQIHRHPLPLEVYPLPVFHPTQPLSLLQLAWTLLRQWYQPPSSKLAHKYIGYLFEDTRSVHVTDPQHIRALWEQGFFGKGTLSRSEPTWIERERTRIAARQQGSITAEEATKARREERRLFKLERARLEREKIETQRKIEQGLAVEGAEKIDAASSSTPDEAASTLVAAEQSLESANGVAIHPDPVTDSQQLDVQPQLIVDQEHLQLTFEEAYFLSYGLGVLDIQLSSKASVGTTLSDKAQLFTILQRMSKPGHASTPAMDDYFTLNYVVYHHFRSLGWVVRPGVKFSVDYLLYNRGPVFSHAEFAVLIMPSYSDPFWHTAEGAATRKLNDQKDWWWLHCINRVQSQVKKTLVLCYVDIPPPQHGLLEERGVAAFLHRYTVREFIVRRWLMNRSRD